MTESLVVTQTRDRTGRTIVWWFEDLHEAERNRPLAWVGAGQLHVDDETPVEVARRAINLFRDELLTDPFQDLAYLVTHRQVEPGGPIEPVKEPA